MKPLIIYNKHGTIMPRHKIDLSNISEEELLNTRICDLPVDINGTWLRECTDKLHEELREKGISFLPEFYLADEWLTPDREPVIGIPFFLAHPPLMKLEKKMMVRAEGSTKEWCMKLLRHETGHAINYAYQLYKKGKWQKTFGLISQDYGDSYKFRPYSKNFVRHLENHYAQYHPDEDFAETFAVWLTPGTDWKTGYRGWKALSKLTYVDELMRKIKDLPPTKPKGEKYWQSSKIKTTLKNYYKKKRCYHAEDFPDFYDAALKTIFSEKSSVDSYESTVHAFIKKYKKELIIRVSDWTGEKKYIIEDILKKIDKRSRSLHLVITSSEPLALVNFSVYLTKLVMNYLHTGELRGNE